MLMFNSFVILLFTKIIHAYPSQIPPFSDYPQAVDLDPSWITTQDDSILLNDGSIPDNPSIPSIKSDSAAQPLLYAENVVDNDEFNVGYSNTPEISETWSIDNSCNSEKSLTTRTDEIDASAQANNRVCPSGLTGQPTAPQPRPATSETKEDFSPPDCTKMPGNPRIAFCCEQGSPDRGGQMDDLSAQTRKRKCRKFDPKLPACFYAANRFCGYCRDDTSSKVGFDMYSPYFLPAREPIAEPPLSAPEQMPPLRKILDYEARLSGREIWEEPPVEPPVEPIVRPGPVGKPEICSSAYLISQGYTPKRNRNVDKKKKNPSRRPKSSS